MKREDMVRLALVMVLAVMFLVGCAGPPTQYRHEENFQSPTGKGGVTQIGASGDITRDGSKEKGFIKSCPFDEGNIITLTDEIIIEEDMPIYQDQKACKNFDHMVKKTKKIIYRHRYVVEGKIVYTWDTDQPNWWAVGFANLGRELISRGIDAAELLAMPASGAIKVGGAVIGDIKQEQESTNTNLNKNKAVNKTKVKVKTNATGTGTGTATINP